MSNQPPSDPYWGQGHGQGQEGQEGQVPPDWRPTPGQQGGPPPQGQPTPPPGLPPYGQPTPPPGQPPYGQQYPQQGQQWDQHGYEPPPTNWGGGGGQYGYQPQQQYGYAKQSQATTALVLSILGFFCCGLPAIPGTIMGRNEVKAVDTGLVDPGSRGTAQAAFIIGAIVLALYAAVISFYVFAIIVTAAGA